MRRFRAVVGYLLASAALAAAPVHALEVAKYVRAEEITGVVVEADTGKPIADAVVAIRFWRNNTGHSGPHCFRSMAVATDAEGRFRFAQWTQENTRANYARGDIKAYKAGYAVPWRAVPVDQSRRSIGDIPFSDTITIPKTDVRLELKPFAGTDEQRIDELGRIVSNFTCRWQAEFDDTVLLMRVRDEIVSSPIANIKPYGWDATVSKWIDRVISSKVPSR